MEEPTFVDISLEDTPELKALEEGEYRVQVTDAEVSTSDKTGGKYILLRLEAPEFPTSKDFTHVLMLPTQSDTEKQVIKRKNRLIEACEALGYDYISAGGVEAKDLINLEGWAYLTVEESAEFGEQNRVRKWVTGQ